MHGAGVLRVTSRDVQHELRACVLVIPRERPRRATAVVLERLVEVLLFTGGAVQPRGSPAQLVSESSRSVFEIR